jgi:hypothetical protein
MFMLSIGGIYLLYKLFNKVIAPWIIHKRTKEIEKNPKWITPKLQEQYYGFEDIDIIIVDSPLGMIPRFEVAKDNNRLKLLIPEDTSVKDIDDIARLALAGKLKIKYGVWYPEKTTQWLSILNYMLDGNDIKIEATKWENVNKMED